MTSGLCMHSWLDYTIKLKQLVGYNTHALGTQTRQQQAILPTHDTQTKTKLQR